MHNMNYLFENSQNIKENINLSSFNNDEFENEIERNNINKNKYKYLTIIPYKNNSINESIRMFLKERNIDFFTDEDFNILADWNETKDIKNYIYLNGEILNKKKTLIGIY